MKTSPTGPALSHLFFADDVILFSEATVAQARVINVTLNDFCRYSGINVQKAKAFISPKRRLS